MIGYELLSILIVVAAFFVGFFICKLLDRRLLKDLEGEMDDLKMRLKGADKLLSEQATEQWRDMEPVVGSSDSGREDGFEGKEALRLNETRISEEASAGLESKSSGLKARAHGTFKQKVKLIKVIGQEDGVKLQKPILGIQETPPVVGESYRIIKEDGGAFYTSVVIKVSPGYIQTLNSVYRIETFEPEEPQDLEEGS